MTVVHRVADWSQVDRRLSSWGDFAKEGRREASTGLASESLWLIELGGSQAASFSISLGSDSRSQMRRQNRKSDAMSNWSDRKAYNTSLKDKKFGPFVMRKYLSHKNNPVFALVWNPGARLRRLTVNQVDVDWKVEDGWITAAAPPAALEPNSGNYANVVAEFISSFEDDNLSSIETVHPSFDRSYVMSGSTIVHSALPWRLTQIHSEAAESFSPLKTQNPVVSIVLNIHGAHTHRSLRWVSKNRSYQTLRGSFSPFER